MTRGGQANLCRCPTSEFVLIYIFAWWRNRTCVFYRLRATRLLWYLLVLGLWDVLFDTWLFWPFRKKDKILQVHNITLTLFCFSPIFRQIGAEQRNVPQVLIRGPLAYTNHMTRNAKPPVSFRAEISCWEWEDDKFLEPKYPIYLKLGYFWRFLAKDPIFGHFLPLYDSKDEMKSILKWTTGPKSRSVQGPSSKIIVETIA